ncbi:MAG TPA: OmpA family protein [Chitinophagales bacterium]|nr:OmpA family protein [Chitinophagales bacterium]
MRNQFLVPVVAICLFSLSSCLVGKKKYDEQMALANKYLAEKNDCNDKLNAANGSIDDLNKQIANLNDQIQKLKDDNASLTDKNKKLNDLKSESDALCDKVKDKLNEIMNSSASEKNKLMKELAEKEKDLMAKSQELDKLSQDLDERDAKVRELQSLIARKDSAVEALKKKMLDALTDFGSGDLTVYEKDGKVYVALSDKLLFATGKYTVEERGKQALKKIAEVLNKNPDISIMVEGHTDNKKYVSTTSSPINSNWDLSVMRASTVTKILVDDNGVDGRRVTPAGHSDLFPVESNETAEGRSKNRRIDIVLTPDMKEIFNILNGAQ